MPLRFLIADDYGAHLKLMGNIVSFLGGEMRAASDGYEALALAAGEDFDVVLMDLQMPGIGGVAAADRLLHQWSGRRTRPRIIAVTGENTFERRALCRAIGMDGFIAKPYEACDLRDALQRVIIGGSCWDDGASRRMLDMKRFLAAIQNDALDTWSGFDGWTRAMDHALREIARALTGNECGRAIVRLDECRLEFAALGFVSLEAGLDHLRHRAAKLADVSQIRWFEGAQADLATCVAAAHEARREYASHEALAAA